MRERALLQNGEAPVQILEGLCNGLGFESAELWLTDPGGGTLQRRGTWSSPALEKLGAAVPAAMAYLNPALLARVCRSGSVVWTPQRSFENSWGGEASTGPEIHGALCFAIRRLSQNCGVVVLFSRSAECPAQTILDLLADLGDQIGLALERSNAEERLHIVSSVFEQRSRGSRRVPPRNYV